VVRIIHVGAGVGFYGATDKLHGPRTLTGQMHHDNRLTPWSGQLTAGTLAGLKDFDASVKAGGGGCLRILTGFEDPAMAQRDRAYFLDWSAAGGPPPHTSRFRTWFRTGYNPAAHTSFSHYGAEVRLDVAAMQTPAGISTPAAIRWIDQKAESVGFTPLAGRSADYSNPMVGRYIWDKLCKSETPLEDAALAGCVLAGTYRGAMDPMVSMLQARLLVSGFDVKITGKIDARTRASVKSIFKGVKCTKVGAGRIVSLMDDAGMGLEDIARA